MWLDKKTEWTKFKARIFFFIFQIYDLVGSYSHKIKARFAPQEKEH